MKSFARQEYPSHVYLNFEEDPFLCELFKGRLNPKILLEKIIVHTNQNIRPHNTLIIFDEIQECGEALTSLKYFQEDASEYPIIAAGIFLV